MTDTLELKLELIGKVTNIEMGKDGWRKISVLADGRQYPVKMDTKKPDIITQAEEAFEQEAVVTARYTEKDSERINPKNNLPYKDRLAFGFLPTTPADVAKAEAASPGNGGARVQKDVTIVRESALKTAFGFGAYAFAGAKEDGDKARLEIYLMALAGRLEAWIVRPADDAEADGPPPLTDSDAPDIDPDIPFV